MASSAYLPNPSRQHNGRLFAKLPIYSSSSSAVQEKFGRRPPRPWFIPVSMSIPGLRTRRLRMIFLDPRRLHHSATSRFGRAKGSAILFLGFLVCLLFTFALGKRFGTREKKWPRPFIVEPTLVFKREDLQRIWHWEISSGHYPSHRSST